MSTSNPRQPGPRSIIRMGAVGLGRAFTIMVPTFAKDPRVSLVAGVDPKPAAQAQFRKDFGDIAVGSLAELLDQADVDAVYLATPVHQHVEQVSMLAAAGKLILLEKPMALTLEECRKISDIVDAAGVHLVVGHSHSFDLPIRRAREIIASGSVGPVRMINALNFTDFVYRPRRPDELDTSQGGGVVFSQAAHQIDIIRLLGGGLVKSVRAGTGVWDPTRPTEGAYSALLTFENGAIATATYSGYAHFDSDEFIAWRGESGGLKDADRYWSARENLANSSAEMSEAALKASQNYGGSRYQPASDEDIAARQHPHFGSLIVSCDEADLRPMPWGVGIYGHTEMSRDLLPEPSVPRSEVIDELCAAIWHDVTPRHNGAWSMATLEVCLAILTSAKEQREIMLADQCPVIDDPTAIAPS